MEPQAKLVIHFVAHTKQEPISNNKESESVMELAPVKGVVFAEPQ